MTKSLIAAMVVSAGLSYGQQGDAANGKKLFLDNQCYACHGFSAQNGPGRHLVPMKLAQAAFTAYVRSPGSRQMPSYSANVLSDAQMGDIWAYIKTLPDAPAAKDIPLLQQIEGEVKK
jgi:mono/diheme cytochrome c family protein